MPRSSDGKKQQGFWQNKLREGVRVEIVSFIDLVLILRQLCSQD